MPTYIVEREIPGASRLTEDDLRGITQHVERRRREARAAVHVAPQLRGRRQDLLRPRGGERRRHPRARAPRRLPGQPGRRGHGGVRHRRPARAARLTAACRPPRRADTCRRSARGARRAAGRTVAAVRGVYDRAVRDLIGRADERARLRAALAAAQAGRGSLLLRVRRGRRGQDAPRRGGARGRRRRRFVRGVAGPAALRSARWSPRCASFLRSEPDGLDRCGPLRSHLALLLPELGTPAPTEDRATLFEAIRCALRTMVAGRPRRDAARRRAGVRRGDARAPRGARAGPARAAAARRGGLPVRRSRAVAPAAPAAPRPPSRPRAARAALDPLDAAEHRAPRRAGARRAPVAALGRHAARAHGRGAVLRRGADCGAAGRRAAEAGPDGAELALDADVPLPETIRDAVLVRTSTLSDAARGAAETAAALGTAFDLDLVAALAGEDGLAELAAGGLVRETGHGRAVFRHPLAREALYDDIPWLRRRALHRRLAQALHERGADPARGGHALARRPRDAARARGAARGRGGRGRRPRLPRRRPARAPGAGPVAGGRARRRAARRRRALRRPRRAGGRPRRGGARAARGRGRAPGRGAGGRWPTRSAGIAGIYALQGDRERALAARRVAAEAYAANGLPGEAAAERLVAAGYLQSAGRHTEAAEPPPGAAGRRCAPSAPTSARGRWASRASRPSRAATSRRASRSSAAGCRSRSSTSSPPRRRRSTSGWAPRTRSRATTAARARRSARRSACAGTPAPAALEQVCLSCMAYVLRELGDWDQVVELGDELITPGAGPDDTLVADGIVGSVLAWRGARDAARPLLERCLQTALRLDVISMLCDSAAALAWLAAAEGDDERASELGRLVLERWARSEDHHYAVWGLRWAAAPLRAHGALGRRPRVRGGPVGDRRRRRPPRRAGRAGRRARRDRAGRGGRGRRRRSSSPARSSSTSTSTSRSSARRSSCAPGRARRRRRARGRHRAADRGAPDRPRGSAPRRSRRAGGRESPRSAGSLEELVGAPRRRASTPTPASRGASSR